MIKIYLDEAGLFDQIKNHQQKANALVSSMEHLPTHLPNLSWVLDSDFYNIRYSGATIADFLFQAAPSPEVRDLLLRVQLKLTRGDYDPLPVGPGVDALKADNKGGIFGTINLKQKEWWNNNTMGLIEDSQGIPKALRLLFQTCNLSHDHLQDYSSTLFPNIYFHCYPSPRLLQINAQEFGEKIFLHLSWLNDCAANTFQTVPTNREIIQNAAAAGVEISPESVNTRQNARAMKERKITIGGISLTCEWHTKFKYDIGRIHFNAYSKNLPQHVTSITGNRVIIGIATGHLST